MAEGTEIYMISGAAKGGGAQDSYRPKGLMGVLPATYTAYGLMGDLPPTYNPAGLMGSMYPSGLTADSVPAIDELGWADFWNAAAYLKWFELNVTKYGPVKAKDKMEQAMGQWSSWGGSEKTYFGDSAFRNYFKQYGIEPEHYWWYDATAPISDTASAVFQDVNDMVKALADGVANFGKGVGGTASLIGNVMPWAVAGVGIYAASVILPPLIKSKRAAVSGKVNAINPGLVLGALVAGYGIYNYYSTLPKITVVKVAIAVRGIQYQMCIGGTCYEDTFYITDEPNLVPFGPDNNYWGLASGNEQYGLISLFIGYKKDDGTFEAITGKTVDFGYENF